MIITPRVNMTPYFGVYKSLVKLGGLPARLTADYLTSLVFYNELVAFTRLGTSVVAGAVSRDTPDIYGNPDRIRIVFPNGLVIYRKYGEYVLLDLSIGDHETPYTAIYNAARIIEEIDLAIKMNIEGNQIMSIWAVANKEIKADLEAMMQRARYNLADPIIIASDSALVTALKAIKSDMPYLVDKLQAAKAQAKSELYSLMGVNYAALQKVSNSVVDEVNANSLVSNLVYDHMIAEWQRAFKEVNALFGISMTIEPTIKTQSEKPADNPDNPEDSKKEDNKEEPKA